MHLRLLRCALGFAACTWGVSIVGVFLSWSAASEALQIEPRPSAMIECSTIGFAWLPGAFGLMGCWYLVLMIWPQRFHTVIPWFGGLMWVEGVILLVHGLRLSLPPFPFTPTLPRVLWGGAILYLSRYAKPELLETGGSRNSLMRTVTLPPDCVSQG